MDHFIETQATSSEKARYLLIHQVGCEGDSNNFLDIPRMFKGDTRRDHLRGQRGIASAENYLKVNTDLDFLIIAYYHCWCGTGPNYHRMVGYQDGKMIHDSPTAQRSTTDIRLGKRLDAALGSIVESFPQCFPGHEYAWSSLTITEPYIEFYAYNRTLLDLVEDTQLEIPEREGVRTICKWFEETHRADWDEADALFAKGRVNRKHLNKLWRLGDIIAMRSTNSDRTVQAHKITQNSSSTVVFFKWEFNGQFCRSSHPKFVGITRTKSDDEEVDITSLDYYPVKYEQGLREELIRRGLKFWRFRRPTLVSFVGTDPRGTEHDMVSV